MSAEYMDEWIQRALDALYGISTPKEQQTTYHSWMSGSSEMALFAEGVRLSQQRKARYQADIEKLKKPWAVQHQN